MKQISIGILLSLLVSLTACMGDGSNSINYHRVGVVRENPMRCIYTNDADGNVFIISSPEFEQQEGLKDGDCCEIDFRSNFADELASGVYQAEIFKYDTLNVFPMKSVMTDTAVVYPNEQLVRLNIKKTVYLDDHLFLQTEHTNHQSDQQDLFEFSYNPNQVVEEDDEGKRIYNLYLRATLVQGTGDSISRWLETTAFQVKDFLSQTKAAEEAAGQTTVNFKINYPERFNADTTLCVWSASEVFTLRFSK